MFRSSAIAFALLAVATLLTSCATVPEGSPETGYTIHGYVGETAQSPAPGATVLLLDGGTGQALATDQANFMGKYQFPGLKPGHYQLQVGQIVQDVVLTGANIRRDIDLSKPTGAMDYAAEGRQELMEQLTAAATGQAAPAGPNDTALASKMAGTWWGFSGSTEVRYGLCPGGTFTDFSESGYSGTMTDAGGNQTGAWGNASQNSGQGSWVIQGTEQSGTISVRYNDGSTRTISYEQDSGSGCYLLDGRQVCQQSSGCD